MLFTGSSHICRYIYINATEPDWHWIWWILAERIGCFPGFFIRQCKPMMHQYDTCLFTIFLILRKWVAWFRFTIVYRGTERPESFGAFFLKANDLLDLRGCFSVWFKKQWSSITWTVTLYGKPNVRFMDSDSNDDFANARHFPVMLVLMFGDGEG